MSAPPGMLTTYAAAEEPEEEEGGGIARPGYTWRKIDGQMTRVPIDSDDASVRAGHGASQCSTQDSGRGKRDMTDIVERLAQAWATEIGEHEDEPVLRHDARWWLDAIAQVLDEWSHPRPEAGRVALHLRDIARRYEP